MKKFSCKKNTLYIALQCDDNSSRPRVHGPRFTFTLSSSFFEGVKSLLANWQGFFIIRYVEVVLIHYIQRHGPKIYINPATGDLQMKCHL